MKSKIVRLRALKTTIASITHIFIFFLVYPKKYNNDLNVCFVFQIGYRRNGYNVVWAPLTEEVSIVFFT